MHGIRKTHELMLPRQLIQTKIFQFVPFTYKSFFILDQHMYHTVTNPTVRVQRWYRRRHHSLDQLLSDHSDGCAFDILRYFYRKKRFERILLWLPEKCVNILQRMTLLEYIVAKCPVKDRTHRHVRNFFKLLSTTEARRCLSVLLHTYH